MPFPAASACGRSSRTSRRGSPVDPLIPGLVNSKMSKTATACHRLSMTAEGDSRLIKSPRQRLRSQPHDPGRPGCPAALLTAMTHLPAGGTDAEMQTRSACCRAEAQSTSPKHLVTLRAHPELCRHRYRDDLDYVRRRPARQLTALPRQQSRRRQTLDPGCALRRWAWSTGTRQPLYWH